MEAVEMKVMHVMVLTLMVRLQRDTDIAAVKTKRTRRIIRVEVHHFVSSSVVNFLAYQLFQKTATIQIV